MGNLTGRLLVQVVVITNIWNKFLALGNDAKQLTSDALDKLLQDGVVTYIKNKGGLHLRTTVCA